MNRLISIGIMILLVGLVLPMRAEASNESDPYQMRINVGVRTADMEDAVEHIIQGYGGVLVLRNAPIHVRTYLIPRDKFDYITSDPDILEMTKYIVEDQKCHVAFVPNDPFYPNQWGPPAIDAEAAWDDQQGNHSLILAIIDTGVDLDHPDLNNNIDTNIDWDFVNNDATAQDDYGHGTHVAGIAAAEINNGIGVAGLAQVTIMSVKVLDSGGSGYWSWVAAGITYAADNGAKVLNMSLGGTGFDQSVEDACDYAYYTKDAVVIAAAGNYGSSQFFYPAAYASVIGVAALQTPTTRAGYSNYGADNVELCAPGSSIYSTQWNNTYTYLDGTSMASPHVAGVASLWRCERPELSAAKTRAGLRYNADDLGAPGYDIYYGYGRVDAQPFND